MTIIITKRHLAELSYFLTSPYSLCLSVFSLYICSRDLSFWHHHNYLWSGQEIRVLLCDWLLGGILYKTCTITIPEKSFNLLRGSSPPFLSSWCVEDHVEVFTDCSSFSGTFYTPSINSTMFVYNDLLASIYRGGAGIFYILYFISGLILLDIYPYTYIDK